MHSKTKIIGLSLITAIGIMTPLQAGKITTQLQGSPSTANGFGGWNLDNVDVIISTVGTNYADNGKDYNKTNGSYDSSFGEGDTFESVIYDETHTKVMGRLHGKDWPVGEPDGIKVLHNVAGVNNGKPENCIINTSYVDELDNPNDGFLDAVAPAVATPLDCAGPWQSHKRFKINFQPSTVDGVVAGTNAEKSVDIVFNVENEAGVRRYQVFQKLDNYSGKRLKGYAVQVGFGVGANFDVATTQDINLSLGLGENDGADIWDELSIATFSHGLWGEPDDHFAHNGFFHDIPSGYKVTLSADKKSFTSNDTLGSNYPTLFGNWLPSIWAPEGIFFDNDNDPSTDAELMAFWADQDGDGVYHWTQGNDNGFAVVDDTTLYQWAMDPLYAVDVVEDTLNLGINFIVEVGDVSGFTDSKFTIRYTPILDEASTQVEPGWITNPPFLSYNGSMGVISINPNPSFVPGTPVTVRVADADLNRDATLIDTFELNVTNDQGEVELITLNELDVNASVFEGVLPTADTTATGSDNDGTLNVTEGSVVTATYNDADTDGSGTLGVAIVSTTASHIPVVTPPPPADDDTSTTTSVNNDDSKGIFSTMDNMSLFAMIFGFLAIGGLIARRKLAK